MQIFTGEFYYLKKQVVHIWYNLIRCQIAHKIPKYEESTERGYYSSYSLTPYSLASKSEVLSIDYTI